MASYHFDGFNSYELALIHILRRRPKHWFSTNELADEAKIAWETSWESLENLHKRGLVVKARKKTRYYWRLYH